MGVGEGASIDTASARQLTPTPGETPRPLSARSEDGRITPRPVSSRNDDASVRASDAASSRYQQGAPQNYCGATARSHADVITAPAGKSSYDNVSVAGRTSRVAQQAPPPLCEDREP